MPANDSLRSALLDAGLSYADVASRLGVDEKTVQRWVTRARLPYPANRAALASLLGKEPEMLWPNAVRRTLRLGHDRELIGVYPRRSDLPRNFYPNLIEQAGERLWFGGYTSYFIWVDGPHVADMLAERVTEGADIRFLLGAPDSPITRDRDAYEGSPLTLGTRIEMTVREITKINGRCERPIEVRHTDRHVAWSLWIFDDDAVMTTHIGPGLGHDSLTTHWRRHGPGGGFDRLVDHFTSLWDDAAA